MYPPKHTGRSSIRSGGLGLLSKGAELSRKYIFFDEGMISSVLSYLNHLGHGADIEYRDRRLMPAVFFVYESRYRKHQYIE
ncbi:hypothetical protein C0Q44_10065 [Paenibacillus sp. PCH8]|nr:hypothetical protein C0Q44_10065 [Paenibacillus sp. PCH8]